MIKKAIIMILVILLVVYLYQENTTIRVTNYQIENQKIPAIFNNYKIFQISDYHGIKNKKINKKILETIKKESPNIIVITGDLIDSSKTNLLLIEQFIKEIKRYAPIYFVTGNHEAYSKNYLKLEKILIENEVIIFHNEGKVIQKEGEQIQIMGIDDPKMKKDNNKKNKEVVKEEIIILPHNKEKYSILLSHRPEFINLYKEQNFDLVLSGHTHGGQIVLPFVGAIFVPNQKLFPKYDSGLFEEGSTSMIISSGIGTSILPIRINNKPQLVIVSLKSIN